MANQKDIEVYSKLLSNGLRECRTCGEQLVYRKSNILRHYARNHKDITAEDGLLKYVLIKCPFITKEEYIDNIVDIMVKNNLPFSFWSQNSVLKHEQAFCLYFTVTCSARATHEVLLRYAVVVRKNISKELSGKIFSVKFNLASRFGKKIIGISVQFVNNWKISVRYLAVKEITQKATAKYLKSVIVDTLKVYGLDIQNVYSITTDSGANVLKTSRELLEVIQVLVEKEEAEFLQKELELLRDQPDENNYQDHE